MNEIAAEVKFDSWADLMQFGFSLENWFFRGQSDAKWSLTTALERAVGIESGDTFRWDHHESWALHRFRGTAHHYLQRAPDREDLLEWVALMQHHGAPTRLLDCTYSFAVASYFAASGAIHSDEFAIWAFNWNAFRTKLISRLDLEGVETGLKFHHRMHEFADGFLSRECSGALVFPVEPPQRNERLVAQQGLFLMPTDGARTYMQNLQCLFEDLPDEWPVINCMNGVEKSKVLRNRALLKFVLPQSCRFDVLQSLQKMNISEATLFPGLDGFARSLAMYSLRDDRD